ncbi:DUF2971 domain-containing protein [Dysgonomonas sp. Shenzhen-Wh21]|uniref:DUF2971 domain-containing protein n=1 Tax=Dysgonomonas TaxID=156973 RepID=UPI00208E94DF|nr:DUF2971 domain-containing protein [Dysgonomonas mossii]
MKLSNKKIYTSCGVYPGKKLKGKNKYIKLYHYTSFDTFVRIWLSKRLLFSDISRVNDIDEAIKSISTSFAGNPGDRIRLAKRIILDYKQISLTKDYDSYVTGAMSPLMWGHYGDKRKGVCIELDFAKLHINKGILYGEVKYVRDLKAAIEIPNMLNSPEDISKHIIKNKKDIFFTKRKDWIEENEFRFLSNHYEYLDIENAITAIYITDIDNESCIMAEKIVDGRVPINLFKYINSMGYKIPIVTEAKPLRNQLTEAQNDPNNALNSL